MTNDIAASPGPQSLLDAGPAPGRLKLGPDCTSEADNCDDHGGDHGGDHVAVMDSISVGSCVSRDYTLHTRSLRNTAGRRAAQCEEARRVEAGKKMLADMADSGHRSVQPIRTIISQSQR